MAYSFKQASTTDNMYLSRNITIPDIQHVVVAHCVILGRQNFSASIPQSIIYHSKQHFEQHSHWQDIWYVAFRWCSCSTVNTESARTLHAQNQGGGRDLKNLAVFQTSFARPWEHPRKHVLRYLGNNTFPGCSFL